MSQTKIRIGSLVIVAGWDRPCQNYFGWVEDLEANEDPDNGFVTHDVDIEYVWHSLEDPRSDMSGGFTTMEEVRTIIERVLAERGVELPPDTFWKVAALQDMNIVRDYNEKESRCV